MSYNKIKLGSDWWLVLLSIPALTVMAGALVGSFMLGCESWARRYMGGPAHEHITLAALCYSDRQCSAQLWQNRAAVHFPAFLWPAPWTHITPSHPPTPKQPGFPYRHHTSQHTPHTLHPPHMQTESPPKPPSTCPLTTLRNHHPCQFQADPAILSATVRVSWFRVSCTAKLLLEI